MIVREDRGRVLRVVQCDLDQGEPFGRGPAEIPDESIDLVMTSPPYKTKDGWSLSLMHLLGKFLARVLKPGGRVCVNLSQLREKPGLSMPLDSQMAIAMHGLSVGQTLIWVKSISLDGAPKRGQFTAINSEKTIDYSFEFLFTFFKPPEPKWDKRAHGVGVPYADKSNLDRGTRGKHGDVRCGGDVWFIPYETTGKTKKKQHQHEYPVALVEKFLRAAGARPGMTLLEPFLGSGTSVAVAKRFGLDCYGIDRSPKAVATALARWGAVDPPTAEPKRSRRPLRRSEVRPGVYLVS